MPTKLYTNRINCLDWADTKTQAKGYWHSILSNAGIPGQYLRRKHGACPICQAGEDRYRYTNKDDDGGYICSRCGHGDGFDLLQKVCGFTPKQSLEFVADWLGPKGFDLLQAAMNKDAIPTVQNISNQSDAELSAKAEYLWINAGPIKQGDMVDQYLCKRGIELDKYPEALRFHPKLKHLPRSSDERTTHPGMLAKLTAPDGSFAGCLRTFLLENGSKAFGKQSKKFMRGTIPAGSAIQLYDAGKVLGIGEGIETCLACHLALEIPVWATTGNKFLEKVIIPPQVNEIIIFADHDEHGAGLRSAQILARRMIQEARSVKILVPPTAGVDWADVAVDGND